MDFSELLSRLEAVKQSGANYMARCPAHDDRTPSLSVSEGEDGRILLKCFAGCTAEAVVAALGLTMRDLFADDPAHPSANGHPRRAASLPPIAEEVVARLQTNMTDKARQYLRAERMLSDDVIDHYQLGIEERDEERRVTIPIRDTDGVIRDIRRWLPPEKRKDDSAKKMKHWKTGYGAPRLFPVDQLEHDELVFCEGELDALASISQGIPAITLTAGIDTVPDEQQAQLFSGKRVTLLKDNDDAGRKGASKRAAALAPYAREVRIATWSEE